MKKSNLIPKQKYVRRRTVDGKKTERKQKALWSASRLHRREGFSTVVGIY